MKILAFTDLHNDISALENIKEQIKNNDIELAVCTGDFTFFEHHVEIMIKKIAELGTDVLLVHGNHEYDEVVEALCKQHKNIHFMHNNTKKFGKYVFIGHGGGGFSLRDPDFVENSKRLMKNVEKNEKIILMTHAPPHNTKVDVVPGYGHVGNKDYRDFIEKNNVVLALCGHIHEGFNKHDKIGNAFVINPGYNGKIIDIK